LDFDDGWYKAKLKVPEIQLCQTRLEKGP